MSAQPHRKAIPAFAPSKGGDDIAAARVFIDTAVSGMRELRTDDTVAVHEWLDAVERNARDLQARAIARAVIEARGDVGTDRIQDSIGSVGSLIGQYEQGLVDVEVQIEAGERIVEEEPLPTRKVAIEEDLEARFNEARRLLENLLPDVDTGGHDEALGKLVAFRPDMMTEADEPAPVPEPATSERLLSIEALMPGLVDHAVKTARSAGKPVTASYAARDAALPSSLVGEWREAVEMALEALVASTLERPEARRARGETTAAHISMQAQGRTDGALELRIECPGEHVPPFEVDRPHSILTHVSDGRVCVVFTARAESVGSAA